MQPTPSDPLGAKPTNQHRPTYFTKTFDLNLDI